MSNHIDLVLRIRPDLALEWSFEYLTLLETPPPEWVSGLSRDAPRASPPGPGGVAGPGGV